MKFTGKDQMSTQTKQFLEQLDYQNLTIQSGLTDLCKLMGTEMHTTVHDHAEITVLANVPTYLKISCGQKLCPASLHFKYPPIGGDLSVYLSFKKIFPDSENCDQKYENRPVNVRMKA
jgi:hypothetical protein